MSRLLTYVRHPGPLQIQMPLAGFWTRRSGAKRCYTIMHAVKPLLLALRIEFHPRAATSEV